MLKDDTPLSLNLILRWTQLLQLVCTAPFTKYGWPDCFSSWLHSTMISNIVLHRKPISNKQSTSKTSLLYFYFFCVTPHLNYFNDVFFLICFYNNGICSYLNNFNILSIIVQDIWYWHGVWLLEVGVFDIFL